MCCRQWMWMLVVLAVGSSSALSARDRGGREGREGRTRRGQEADEARTTPTRDVAVRDQQVEPTRPATRAEAAAHETEAEERREAAEQKLQRLRERAEAGVPPTQDENLETLKTDLQAIRGKSEVTAEQKTALKSSLAACLDGACKPSQASVNQLAAGLSNAAADGALSMQEVLTIQKSVQTVLNEANITDAEIEALKASAKAVLDASNVTREDAEKILKDIEAVATTARDNAKIRVP